jgi:AraC-like DNA-binding protein
LRAVKSGKSEKVSIVFGHIDQFDYVIGENVRHRFPAYIHQTLCVGMVTGGKRSIRFPHREEIFDGGEIFVINAGQSHAVMAEARHSYIAVTAARIPASHCYRNKIRSAHCRELFENMLSAISNGEQDRLPLFMAGILDALEEFKTTLPDRQSPATVVQKALGFIRRHYCEPVTVSDIAAHLCISPSHFCHLFRQYVGISPYSYLLQYRIKRSRMLLEKQCSVFDAAIASGFYDSSHYIRHFISCEGVSPKHYQKYFS